MRRRRSPAWGPPEDRGRAQDRTRSTAATFGRRRLPAGRHQRRRGKLPLTSTRARLPLLTCRGECVKAKASQEIEQVNLSRITCVPFREDPIGGYAAIDLLIIDEAARVPDDLYRASAPCSPTAESTASRRPTAYAASSGTPGPTARATGSA